LAESGVATAPGSVLLFSGGEYQVRLDDGDVVRARLRGRLKLEARTGDRVVAGDRVRVLLPPGESPTIESVEPRRSELVRRAPGKAPRAKVIVANVDQVVAVVAAAHPAPRLRLLDRLLVLAESSGLPAVVVVNKLDLVGAEETAGRFAPYRAAGYPVLLSSVVTGAGIEELRDRLCGRESVVTGPSGVGKSSLLNGMEPGLGLRVGAVSDAVRKGRHTTVTARLIPLGCGGFVVDTPGLREVGLWDVDPDALDHLFPEFRELTGACRFGRSCTHIHEPGCAIREAVEAGRIDRGRWESYGQMREGERERKR
jgi:ribosome biogenesis GTPase